MTEEDKAPADQQPMSQAAEPEPPKLPCARCGLPPPACHDDFECDCIPPERLEEFDTALTDGAAAHLVRETRRLFKERDQIRDTAEVVTNVFSSRSGKMSELMQRYFEKNRPLDPEAAQKTLGKVDETLALAEKFKGLEAKADELSKRVGALCLERNELHTKYLRSLADFDNYQKRVKREQETIKEAATRDLVRDLVFFLDSFNTTLSMAGDLKTVGEVIQAFSLVQITLLSTVALHGVQPFVPHDGDPFDPSRHEAVQAIPTVGAAKDEVAAVMRVGYALGKKVLRPAGVVVRKAALPGETLSTPTNQESPTEGADPDVAASEGSDGAGR